MSARRCETPEQKSLEEMSMKYGRTYNFSAGPAMMPEEVLEEIAAEMMNYRGSGMCVMEMSTAPRSFSRSGTRPRRTCVS